MVSRLFPMGIIIAFEHRPYKLGETIDLTVELIPRRDIEVREARVDLVREMRYTEVTTVLVPPLPSRAPRLGTRTSTPVHKRVSETYRDAYLQGSAVFLRDERLPWDRTSTYNVGLEIKPERPTRQSGRTRWRLVTTVDVVGARHITARRTVNVATLSQPGSFPRETADLEPAEGDHETSEPRQPHICP